MRAILWDTHYSVIWSSTDPEERDVNSVTLLLPLSNILEETEGRFTGDKTEFCEYCPALAKDYFEFDGIPNRGEWYIPTCSIHTKAITGRIPTLARAYGELRGKLGNTAAHIFKYLISPVDLHWNPILCENMHQCQHFTMFELPYSITWIPSNMATCQKCSNIAQYRMASCWCRGTQINLTYCANCIASFNTVSLVMEALRRLSDLLIADVANFIARLVVIL